MSNVQERKDILDSLEDSYREDLAIHLYSTLLSRRVDKVYPNGGWASWPLHVDQVPNPRTSLKYADTIIENDSYINDIDLDHEKLLEQHRRVNEGIIKKRKRRGKQPANADESIVETTNGEEDESDLNAGSEDEVADFEDQANADLLSRKVTVMDLVDETNTPKRISNIAYKQTTSNSKADLVNEIHALVQKKIGDKLKKLNNAQPKWKDLELVTDSQTDTTVEISRKIAGRVNGLLNDIEGKYTSLGKLKSGRHRVGWQQILLSGLRQVDSPYESYDPDTYQRFYDKCEDLFENINYKYEYENEEGSEEEPENDISNASSETEDTDRIRHNKRPGFDVVEYLKSLGDDPDHTYGRIRGQHLQNRQKHIKQNADFRTLFTERLAIQRRASDLRWDRRLAKKQRFSFHIQASSWEELRSNAIRHGTNTIDANAYLLEDY